MPFLRQFVRVAELDSPGCGGVTAGSSEGGSTSASWIERRGEMTVGAELSALNIHRDSAKTESISRFDVFRASVYER